MHDPAGVAAGQWVICDRFVDFDRVYQGELGQVDGRLIKALERVSVGNLRPDLTLVLDVPAELGLERAAGRRGGQVPIALRRRRSNSTTGCAKLISCSPLPSRTAA